MWTSLAFLAALSLTPGQADALAVTNVKNTYGVRGPIRPDNKIIPGDAFILTFDIEGITVDESGKVLYSMATEVTDGNGKVQYKQDARDLEAINALGGKTLPAYVHIDVGLDQPPGEYTVKVTITDRAAKRNTVLSQKFQVQKKAFGMVRLTTTSDAEGQGSTALFGSGETAFVNYSVVGFARGKDKKPNVNVEMRVLDEKGQPTLAKPFTGTLNAEVPDNIVALPVQFMLSLNRPGKFTVELNATDQNSKESAQLSFPLTVLPWK
jgi:hypothetical protein